MKELVAQQSNSAAQKCALNKLVETDHFENGSLSGCISDDETAMHFLHPEDKALCIGTLRLDIKPEERWTQIGSARAEAKT